MFTRTQEMSESSNEVLTGDSIRELEEHVVAAAQVIDLLSKVDGEK